MEEQKDSLTELVLSQKEGEMDRVLDSIEDDFNLSLERDGVSPIGKLREEVLVGVLLPFLAGEKTAEDLEAMGLPYSSFLRISARPDLPIAIVNSEGRVIFNLPPLVYGDHLDYFGSKAQAIIKTYNAISQISDNQALVMNMFEKVKGQMIPNFDKEKFREYLDAWYLVFKYYGYFDPIPDDILEALPENAKISPFTPTKEEVSRTRVTTPTSSDDVELEFD